MTPLQILWMVIAIGISILTLVIICFRLAIKDLKKYRASEFYDDVAGAVNEEKK